MIYELRILVEIGEESEDFFRLEDWSYQIPETVGVRLESGMRKMPEETTSLEWDK